MAFTRYHNIAGATAVTTQLIKSGSNASELKSIVITNTRASNSATVDLFLQNNTGSVVKNFYILKNSEIPANVTLVLDNESMISFDNNKFGLYITVGASDTLDVLINN